jgi:hypothetical protein
MNWLEFVDAHAVGLAWLAFAMFVASLIFLYSTIEIIIKRKG